MSDVERAVATPETGQAPAKSSPESRRSSSPGAAAGTLPAFAPPSLLGLQRTAGNQATAWLVQRQGAPNASVPPPNSSQPGRPRGACYFEGHGAPLRPGGMLLRGPDRRSSRPKGLMARRRVHRAAAQARRHVFLFKRHRAARPAARTCSAGLDDANRRIDHEREEFSKQFETHREQRRAGLLDGEQGDASRPNSQRLGITGDIVSTPDDATLPELLRLSDDGRRGGDEDRGTERSSPAAKIVDKTGAEPPPRRSASWASPRRDRPVQPRRTSPLVEEEHRHSAQRWMRGQRGVREGQRRSHGRRESQSLALYTDQPGAAAQAGSAWPP